MRKLMITFMLIVGLILSGCNSENNQKEEKQENGKLVVYSTVYPLMNFTKVIGGEYVEVHTVYPPGTDEHTFEPTQKDIIDMAKSDLFLYIGHNLEGFVKSSADIFKDEGVKMVAVGEAVNLEASHEDHSHQEGTAEDPSHSEEDHEHDEGDVEEHHHEEDEHGHNHGDVDPHIWLDPLYAKEMAEIIKDSLAELKPDQKEYFEKNYTQLSSQLEELHHEFETTIKNAPKKKIVVSHAAYGYWEKRYGIEQISIAGISTSSEPSQKKLKEIIETAKNDNIQYVLVEQNAPSKLAEIVQSELKGKTLTLHNLSVLTKKDIERNEDYFSLMKKNLSTLEKALH